MTKKRLNKAVDRGFRLAGNVLMRRAIARLIHIDDASLSQSGLTRTAISDFLTTPLRTDPHRYFRHRRAQDADTLAMTTLEAGNPIKDMNGHCPNIGAPRAQTAPADVIPVTVSVKPTMALRMRVLAAGALIGLGALTACSGSVFEPDPALAKREQPARCPLKSKQQLIVARAPHLQDRSTAGGLVLTYTQRPRHQRNARDGPADDAV